MTGIITARTIILGGAGRPGSFTTFPRITLTILATIQTIITVVIQVITDQEDLRPRVSRAIQVTGERVEAAGKVVPDAQRPSGVIKRRPQLPAAEH
jgi:hypothetical protein